MSASAPETTKQPKPRKRYTEYVIVLLILVFITLAALYQEQLSAFVALKKWDSGAPARQVTKFLTALQKADEATATSVLEPNSSYKPLKEKDKWNGYFIISQAGKMLFTLEDSAPKGEIKDLAVEFNSMGKGSALVSALDGRGKMVDFRLEMQNGEWRITEMRGGKPEKVATGPTKKMTPPPMPGGGGKPKSGKSPH